MKSLHRIIPLLVLTLTFLSNGIHATDVSNSRFAPWMDSIVAEGVRKIAEANFLIHHPEFRSASNPIVQNEFGSYVINIDAAKWTPVLYPQVYSYEKIGAQPFFGPNTSTKDSLANYNLDHVSAPATYVAYFNVVINNFPFELNKDLSTVNGNENQCMFAQLQQLKVIDNEAYANSRNAFYTIVKNIAVLAANLQGIDDIVVLGTANMLGQFSNKNQNRASFLAQTVVTENLDTSLTWVKQLYQIPKMFSIPFAQLVPSTVAERNTQVAIAIRNFLDCNLYGICRPDNTMFTSLYARWLYGSLAGNQLIDQQLLMNTSMRINGLPNEMAWAVLTAEFEQGHDQYVNTPLGPIYNAYTNNTLTTISTLCSDIVRAQVALKVQTNIGKDSALYYGRLVYRVPSYMLSIDPYQRVNLLNAITNSSCSDINISNSISNYTNHCERIAKALYTHIPQSDLKTFLDQLKSSGLLWDLSYRLDNSSLGFFGNDNYTDFVFTISSYWKAAYPELASPSRTANVNYHVFKWESSYFNANAMISTNHSSNQIIAAQMARSGCPWTNLPLATITMDVYDPVTIHVAEGSIIPGLPGVKDLTVPAFFLDWLSHKKMLDDAATTAHVTLAVLALATGVGELYQATTMGMRVISALEVTISASDLVLLNENFRQGVISLFPTPQEGQDFLQVYERITMVINFSVAAKGLVDHLDNDFTYFSQKFDEQENGLKNVLGENSPEFRGMEKLRGEVAENVVNLGSFGLHSTKFDEAVFILPKEPLFGNDAASFLDQQYRTVQSTAVVRGYRNFGGNAKVGGTFITTNSGASRHELAILDEWNNTMRFEAEIEIPVNTKMNLGKVGPQTSTNGQQTLLGGADQVILPFQWNTEWVKSITDRNTGRIYNSIQEFATDFPELVY